MEETTAASKDRVEKPAEATIKHVYPYAPAQGVLVFYGLGDDNLMYVYDPNVAAWFLVDGSE